MFYLICTSKEEKDIFQRKVVYFSNPSVFLSFKGEAAQGKITQKIQLDILKYGAFKIAKSIFRCC